MSQVNLWVDDSFKISHTGDSPVYLLGYQMADTDTGKEEVEACAPRWGCSGQQSVARDDCITASQENVSGSNRRAGRVVGVQELISMPCTSNRVARLFPEPPPPRSTPGAGGVLDRHRAAVQAAEGGS